MLRHYIVKMEESNAHFYFECIASDDVEAENQALRQHPTATLVQTFREI